MLSDRSLSCPVCLPVTVVAKLLDGSRCVRLEPSSSFTGTAPPPLGTEVNVSPGDFVLDGVTAPPKRGTAPVFGSCLLWPNRGMDEDATWCGSRSRLSPHCVRRGPSSSAKGHSSPFFSANVCCGHGRPSQLLLSSCNLFCWPASHTTV